MFRLISHATAGQLRARGEHLQGVRGREYFLKKRCDHMACLKGKDARDGKGRQQQTCEQTGLVYITLCKELYEKMRDKQAHQMVACEVHPEI